jgi:hypothetical protein
MAPSNIRANFEVSYTGKEGLQIYPERGIDTPKGDISPNRRISTHSQRVSRGTGKSVAG